MNKTIVMMVVGLAVVVAALLAMLRVLGNITDQQMYDVGLKVGLLLVIGLIAAVVLGMISKPKADK